MVWAIGVYRLVDFPWSAISRDFLKFLQLKFSAVEISTSNRKVKKMTELTHGVIPRMFQGQYDIKENGYPILQVSFS